MYEGERICCVHTLMSWQADKVDGTNFARMMMKGKGADFIFVVGERDIIMFPRTSLYRYELRACCRI